MAKWNTTPHQSEPNIGISMSQEEYNRQLEGWRPGETLVGDTYDTMEDLYEGMTTMMKEVVPTEGRKDDASKIRMDLVPPELLEGVADILTFGAAKYGERNWEKGMKWSRPFGALMRHMWAWWKGEKADAETGKSHLWHAACCIAFLMAYEERAAGTDDRPIQPDGRVKVSAKEAAANLERKIHEMRLQDMKDQLHTRTT